MVKVVLSAEEEELLGLVWEAWKILDAAYDDQGGIDTEDAVGKAVTGMLRAADVSPYPILARLYNVQGDAPRKMPEELDDIWRTWVLLLNEEELAATPDEIIDAATDGLLLGLDDPFATYMSTEEYADIREDYDGEYEGIGAYVQETTDGRTAISQPIAGGPAEAIGLLPGDLVLNVNGRSVEGLSLQQVVDRIKGPRGTDVAIEVERFGEPEPLIFVVTRDLVEVASVEFELLPLDVWYIRILRFADDTADEFEVVLRDALEAGVRGMVLDLRGNLGGSVGNAISVSSEFLVDGIVMFEMDPDGKRKDWAVEDHGLMPDIPLAVIVNQFSASSSEVVAGALQDRGRAKLYGEQTFGKGAVQYYRELSNGSALKVTSSYWHTPSGTQFHGEGIMPDESVTLLRSAVFLSFGTGEDVIAIDTQIAAAFEDVITQFGESMESVQITR